MNTRINNVKKSVADTFISLKKYSNDKRNPCITAIASIKEVLFNLFLTAHTYNIRYDIYFTIVIISNVLWVIYIYKIYD